MEKGGVKGQSSLIETRARKLAEPVITARGYSLWDVCFEKEGAMWYLRILFDKEGGINSEECEEITEPLNKLMDAEDFIKYVDILDIGSPGLTKTLRYPEHFQKCVGEPVKLSLKDENNKTVIVRGTLIAYDAEGDFIEVQESGKEAQKFPIKKCNKIQTDIE